MSDYFQRLKRHPGAPMAAALTMAGVVLAATSEHDWRVMLVSSVWWIPVLITARTQP